LRRKRKSDQARSGFRTTTQIGRQRPDWAVREADIQCQECRRLCANAVVRPLCADSPKQPYRDRPEPENALCVGAKSMELWTTFANSTSWEEQMPDLSIKIASSPNNITELVAALEKKRSQIPASLNQSASHRDFSIVVVVLTAVTTEVIRSVFAILKEFITEKLKKDVAQKGFAIQIDETSIEIKTEGDLTKLEEVEKAKKAEVGHA
jgi:hypothetical protein